MKDSPCLFCFWFASSQSSFLSFILAVFFSGFIHYICHISRLHELLFISASYMKWRKKVTCPRFLNLIHLFRAKLTYVSRSRRAKCSRFYWKLQLKSLPVMTHDCTMISHPDSAKRAIANLPWIIISQCEHAVYYYLLYAAHRHTDMGGASFPRECTVQMNQNYMQPTSKSQDQLCWVATGL